jgi:hypothetical protein
MCPSGNKEQPYPGRGEKVFFTDFIVRGFMPLGSEFFGVADGLLPFLVA